MQNKVELISITHDYMRVLKKAASQCYQKEATDKVIDHIINAGHLSVLEHCYATFELTCSIQMLLQLTRHRHLSFTVQSSRGSMLKDIYSTHDTRIDTASMAAGLSYNNRILLDDIPNEVAAYCLPKAAMYSLVVTGNFRAWYEYLSKRLCKRAQTEHRQVAERIHVLLQEAAPEIFCRNLMHCKECLETSCSFKGDK